MKGIPFLLSAIAADGEMYRVEALRCGKWFYPSVSDKVDDPRNYFEITPGVLDELAKNFGEGAKGYEIPLNLDHGADCGWIKGVERVGDSLFARFEVTDASIKQRVDDGTLKYASSELNFAWVDPEACAHGDCTAKRVLEAIALTNRPYLKRMEAVSMATLCEFPNFTGAPAGTRCGASRNHPKEATVATKTTEQYEAEIDGLKKQLAETQASGGSSAKLSELEAALAENGKRLAEAERRERDTRISLHTTQLKERLQALVRKGKLTVPVYQKALRLCEVLIQGDSRTVTLSSKVTVQLGEGKTEELDKLDVVEQVIEILSVLPDSIATDGDRPDVELDESGKAGKDYDVRLTERAEQLRKADKTLSLRDAYRLAERDLQGGNA